MSCSHPRSLVQLGVSGRSVPVCRRCPSFAEQLERATGIPRARQRLERRGDTTLVWPTLHGGCDDTKYVAPIVFAACFVAALIVGVVLVVLWEQMDMRFATVWWVGVGFVIAAAVLGLIAIPCWIYACFCTDY